MNQEDYDLTHKQLGKATMFGLRETCNLPAMDLEVSSFNLHIEKIYQQVDKEIFEAVLKQLIIRHESLRSIVVKRDDKWRQQILAESDIVLPLMFFGFDSPLTEENGKAISLSLSRYAFDFLKEIPIRCALIKLQGNRCAITFTVNHVICDWYSLRIILNELQQLYSAKLLGQNIQLKPLSFQLKDYAIWEKQMIQDDGEKSSHVFWQKKLSGSLPVNILKDFYSQKFNLGISYRRSLANELLANYDLTDPEKIDGLVGIVHRATSYSGSSYRFVVTNQVLQGLRQLVIHYKCSLFTLLASTIFFMMYKLTDRRDLIIGMETAIRDNDHLRSIVGWLSNTIFLRSQVHPDTQVSKFVTDLYIQTIEGLQHKCYPIEKILMDTDLSLDSIGGVYLNFNSAPSEQLEDLETREIIRENDKPYFDLDCILTEYANALEVTFRYKADLFSNNHINLFSANFTDVLTELLTKKIFIGEIISKTTGIGNNTIGKA